MERLEGFLSVGQAARLLGVSPDRIRQLLRAGKLPQWRTPLGSLIPREAVEQLARERQKRGTTRGE